MNLDVTLLLNSISTVCFFLGVFIINGFKQSVDKMQTSVQSLNVNIATLIEKDLNKQVVIDESKERMVRLETDIYGLGTKVNLVEMQVHDLKKTIENLYSKRN